MFTVTEIQYNSQTACYDQLGQVQCTQIMKDRPYTGKAIVNYYALTTDGRKVQIFTKDGRRLYKKYGQD